MNKLKRVVCVETGQEYDSISQLAKSLDIALSQVSTYILKGKPIKGLHYKTIQTQTVKYKCKQTGQMFENVSKLAKAYGLSEAYVYKLINSNRNKKTFSCMGLHFVKIGED